MSVSGIWRDHSQQFWLKDKREIYKQRAVNSCSSEYVFIYSKLILDLDHLQALNGAQGIEW